MQMSNSAPILNSTRWKCRYPHYLAILLACVFLQGCEQPRLAPLPSDATILAFGDSLTQGVGADESNSYPHVLARLSGVRVVNAGVSGEVTEQGLKRLAEILKETTPDLLILIEGGNDILRNKDPALIEKNLAGMIELAQSRGVAVVLIGVPAKRLFSDAAPFYADLAERYQLVYEDDLIASLLRERGYKSDAIHFNEQGYRMMAEAIHQLLVDNGAL